LDSRFANVRDELWNLIEPLLPKPKVRRDGKGRPRVPDRAVLAGIIVRLRTGCQWRALGQEFGSGATCHRRMQEWERHGVFNAIFRKLVGFYDAKKGLKLKWGSMDAAIVKAPKGGS